MSIEFVKYRAIFESYRVQGSGIAESFMICPGRIVADCLIVSVPPQIGFCDDSNEPVCKFRGSEKGGPALSIIDLRLPLLLKETFVYIARGRKGILTINLILVIPIADNVQDTCYVSRDLFPDGSRTARPVLAGSINEDKGLVADFDAMPLCEFSPIQVVYNLRSESSKRLEELGFAYTCTAKDKNPVLLLE